MAPAGTANGTTAAGAAGGGGFAATTASLRQCILAHYREEGEAGRRAVLAAIQTLLEQQGLEAAVVSEAVEVAFRQVLNEDLMARALPAGKDVLVRLMH